MKKIILLLVFGLTSIAGATNADKVIQLSWNGQIAPDEIWLYPPSTTAILDFVLADGWDMEVMELRLEITGPGVIALPQTPTDILAGCWEPWLWEILIVPDGIVIVGVSFGACTGKIVDFIEFHCEGPGDVIVQIIDVGTNNSPTYGDIDQSMMGSIIIHQISGPTPPECWDYLTQCHGDSDNTGDVKASDFMNFKDSYYKCYPDPNYNPCVDFDRDGCVKSADFMILKNNWFQTVDPNCPQGDINGIYQ